MSYYFLINNDIFIHIITLINLYFLINNMNLLLLLISIDNISYANDFLIKSIFNRLNISNRNDIIIQNTKLYKLNIIERYIFYIFIYLFYSTIKILILNKCTIIIKLTKLLLSLTSLPIILNNIIYDNYEDIFNRLTFYKDKIIRLIFCEQIYSIIAKLNTKLLDNRLILNKEEIIFTLNDELSKCNNIRTEIFKFIKNTLVVSLLSYCKSKSIVYYKLIKYIYIYNSGSYYINNINIEDAKQKFIKIFETKSYKDLNNPMIIHSLLCLYYDKKTDTNWDEINGQINYDIICFMTLWTCGSFFSDKYRIMIMFIIKTILYFTSFDNIEKKYNIIYDKKYIFSLILLILFYNVSSNIIFLSLIYQFGYYCIDNFFTKGIMKSIHNNILNKLYINFIKNYKLIIQIIHKDIILIIRNIVYGLIMKYLFKYNIHYGYMFLILIMNFDKNIYNKILFVLFYVSILNKNNDIKLFILGYICSLFINWIKYYDLFYDLIKINNNNNNNK